MKIKVIKADEFAPSMTQKFFFDSNVWLYLTFPQSSDVSKSVIHVYSNLFKDVLSQDCLIETNILQISELVNRVIQTEYKLYKKLNPKWSFTFKEFRESTEGVQGLKNAKVLTDNIIKCSSLRDGIFALDELEELVRNCDKADFNDLYFAKFCEKKKQFW